MLPHRCPELRPHPDQSEPSHGHPDRLAIYLNSFWAPFSASLTISKGWVNKSRYEARYDTQYDTGYESGPKPKLRSLDQLSSETENISWNPDVWGPGLLLSQFQDHLLMKDQFVDDLLHHLPDQTEPGSVVRCSLRRTDQDFSKVNVSVLITGNEVFNFVSKIRHLE